MACNDEWLGTVCSVYDGGLGPSHRPMVHITRRVASTGSEENEDSAHLRGPSINGYSSHHPNCQCASSLALPLAGSIVMLRHGITTADLIEDVATLQSSLPLEVHV